MCFDTELRWKQLWLCLHYGGSSGSVRGDVVHLVVRSERASSEKSLFGERGHSASMGTILKGKHSHNTYQFLSVCIFSVLITSIPVQMVNETVFIIAIETDFIHF